MLGNMKGQIAGKYERTETIICRLAVAIKHILVITNDDCDVHNNNIDNDYDVHNNNIDDDYDVHNNNKKMRDDHTWVPWPVHAPTLEQ